MPAEKIRHRYVTVSVLAQSPHTANAPVTMERWRHLHAGTADSSAKRDLLNHRWGCTEVNISVAVTVAVMTLIKLCSCPIKDVRHRFTNIIVSERCQSFSSLLLIKRKMERKEQSEDVRRSDLERLDGFPHRTSIVISHKTRDTWTKETKKGYTKLRIYYLSDTFCGAKRW